MTTPRPFVIDVEQSTLDRIDRKLADSRIGYAPQDDRDWRYGTDASSLRAFVDQWRNEYDWRAQEAMLNRTRRRGRTTAHSADAWLAGFDR